MPAYRNKALVFIPTLLLGLVFLRSERFLISDDLGYWDLAFHWKTLFTDKPIWAALWEIYAQPAGRASFHPLLGVPFLWVFGSIKAATIAVGLALSGLMCVAVYRIFRASGVEEMSSIVGAVAVGTFPVFLGQGRYFMMDFPFATLALTALSFLLMGRYRSFAAFFALTLLIRPVEGLALAPAYVLFLAFKENSFRKALHPSVLKMMGCGVLAAFVFLLFRLQALLNWLWAGTFPVSGASGSAHATVDLGYVPEKFFLVFGLSGSAIFSVALFQAMKGWRREAGARAQVFLILQLLAMLALNSTLDDAGPRGNFFRFLLAFIVFSLIACCISLLKRPGWLRTGLIAWLIVANAAAYADFFQMAVPHHDVRVKNPSHLFSLSLVQSMNHRSRVEGFMEELDRLLPKAAPVRILLAGRDTLLYNEAREMILRAKMGSRSWIIHPWVEPQLGRILRKKMRRGDASLGEHGFALVLFAPRPRFEAMVPYPFPEFVEALEKGKWKSLGLIPLGELKEDLAPGMEPVWLFGTELAY